MTAPDGSAVRFFVITDSDPYGGTAIDTIERLDSRMPSLLNRAGLGRATAGIGGDTALTGELVGSIGDTGLRVGPAAIAWVFLLLALLLRALVAPLYLLAASILGVAAALGLTVYVFQDLLGYGQLSLFVPFSAAILLLALGSDYSVFVVDRIWQESRHRAPEGGDQDRRLPGRERDPHRRPDPRPLLRRGRADPGAGLPRARLRDGRRAADRHPAGAGAAGARPDRRLRARWRLAGIRPAPRRPRR